MARQIASSQHQMMKTAEGADVRLRSVSVLHDRLPHHHVPA